MTNYFTALMPPAYAIDHLKNHLFRHADIQTRFTPPETWHVTLAYHPDGDDIHLASALRQALRGKPAPTISLGRSGSFGTTLWVDARCDDKLHTLTEAARAINADLTHAYCPHLTFGRGEPFETEYNGPPWAPLGAHVFEIGTDIDHDYRPIAYIPFSEVPSLTEIGFESIGPWKPDWAVPPGETIAEELDTRGIAVSDFARDLDIDADHLRKIITGQRPITHKEAAALERRLGVSAAFWNNSEQIFRDHLFRTWNKTQGLDQE